MHSDGEDIRGELAKVWPPFGLRIVTKRLELRMPLLAELSSLARHAPDVVQVSGGNDRGDEDREVATRSMFQQVLRHIGTFVPWDWVLPLAVFVDGKPCGLHELRATDLVTQGVVSASYWLLPDARGLGYGLESRSALLEFAFVHLGAKRCSSVVAANNEISLHINNRLGFTPMGVRDEHEVDVIDMTLSAADLTDIGFGRVDVLGLDRCLAWFRGSR